MSESLEVAITNYIEVIRYAEEQASVTNEMVAAVLNALYDFSSAIGQRFDTHKETSGEAIRQLQVAITDLSSALTAIRTAVEANTAGVSRINQKRGEVDGFAPLDNYGELPLIYLPAAIMNVCTFAGVRDTAPAPEDINTTDTPANGNIFFCKDTGRFLCYSSASGSWYTKLYASASPLFGTPETDSDKPGIAPRFHRLYLNALNRSLYMTMDGTDLVQITEPPASTASLDRQ